MIYQEERGLIVGVWMLTVFPGLLAIMMRGLVRFCYDRRQNPYIIAADVLIVLSFIASVWYSCGMSCLVIWGLIRNGGGRDEEIIPVDNGTTEKALMYGWVTGNVYYFGLYAAKGAIIALLHGIIPESRYVHRKALFWVTCLVTVCGVFTIAFNLFACQPIQNNWLLGPNNCYAYRLPKVLISSSALQIFTDLVLIALPLPLLRGLRISLRQRLGLASIFCLGFFCVFATMMRLILVYGPQDPNNNPSSIIWSGIEMSTGICVACAPAVRTFIGRRNNGSIDSKGRWRRRRRRRENMSATGVAELDERPEYDLLGIHPGGVPESGKSSAHGQPESSQESAESTKKTQDREEDKIV